MCVCICSIESDGLRRVSRELLLEFSGSSSSSSSNASLTQLNSNQGDYEYFSRWKTAISLPYSQLNDSSVATSQLNGHLQGGLNLHWEV